MGPFLASDTGHTLDNVASGQTSKELHLPDGGVLAPTPLVIYRALAVVIVPGGTATLVTFLSKQTGLAVSPAYSCTDNTPFILPYNPYGWFDSLLGESFGVTTGSGSTCGISIVYGKIYVGT